MFVGATRANCTFLHISDSLLVTASHVKMELGVKTISLNNERLLSDKKIENCSSGVGVLLKRGTGRGKRARGTGK